MGRANTRAALLAYFTNAAIPNVGTIYESRPVIIDEQDYEQNMSGSAVPQTSNGSNAVFVFNLPHTKRERRALVGRGNVQDTYVHKVALEIFFANVGGDALAAQNDHDAIMDAVNILIRSDPTLGALIWSAGEYAAGIDVDQAAAYTSDDGLTIFIPAVVRFEVWEWISGPAGV